MRVIGAQRTPFAVASGGFTHNEGFSSTPGVFISLARMKKIVLSQDNSTVEIGMGQVSAMATLILFLSFLV